MQYVRGLKPFQLSPLPLLAHRLQSLPRWIHLQPLFCYNRHH